MDAAQALILLEQTHQRNCTVLTGAARELLVEWGELNAFTAVEMATSLLDDAALEQAAAVETLARLQRLISPGGEM